MYWATETKYLGPLFRKHLLYPWRYKKMRYQLCLYFATIPFSDGAAIMTVTGTVSNAGTSITVITTANGTVPKTTETITTTEAPRTCENDIGWMCSKEGIPYALNIKICSHKLTHWGRVTHICVSKLAIIGSDNGLSPGRRQAIIWTNAGIMVIGPLGTNFSEI